MVDVTARIQLEHLMPKGLLGLRLFPIRTSSVRVWSLSKEVHCEDFLLGLPIADDFTIDSGGCAASIEMYGGAGLAGNAGGVRCANVGNLQIKGIGSTQLAGNSTDKWHRHGALSLQDAVRECVMGELFHCATPHGAVRGVGIADLAVSFVTEVGLEGLPGSAPRALLFRELSVRVAHFMRSSFMNAGPELAHRELDRMRDGIPRFVDWLCSSGLTPGFDAAARGVELVFDRLMRQVAVLRAKRLVHGSLIPSNFCIDGRLLDFTTSTAVSTYQPVMVALGGLTTQQQHHQVLEALPDVLFYISKFDPRCAVPRAHIGEMAEVLKAQLQNSHHQYLMEETLALFGFSQTELKRLSQLIQNELLSVLVAAIRQGTVRGHFYFGGDEHPMLPQEGKDDVFALIASAIAASTGLSLPASALYTPRPDAFSDRVREGLTRAYQAAVLEVLPGAAPTLNCGMAWLIRAMQRNADLTPLYRRNLDGLINEVCTTGGDFGALVESTVADWRGVFESPADGTVALRGWLCTESAVLLPSGQLQFDGNSYNSVDLARLTPPANIRPRHRWLLEVAAANRWH